MIRIEENGDRAYLRKKDNSVAFIYDKYFTSIMSQEKPVEKGRLFIRLPQKQELRPELKWDVPPWSLETRCGDMPVHYSAVSEDGREITLTINGRDEKIRTIRVNYEASMSRTCEGPYGWRKTAEILYSPGLREVISAKNLTWNAYCPKRRCFERHAPHYRHGPDHKGEQNANHFYVLRIIIPLYLLDNQHHNLPHIHAKYAEFEASIGLEDGEILAGVLPRKQLRLVQAWIELHRDELMADWELAANGEIPYKIEPL